MSKSVGQSNKQMLLNQKQAAAPKPPGASGDKFTFTAAKRAVNTVFDQLQNLDIFGILRETAGDARGDIFDKGALADSSPESVKEYMDKTKNVSKNQELAKQKLEQSINNLTPLSFQFALSVVLYKFPELFERYTRAHEQHKQVADKEKDEQEMQVSMRKANLVARAKDLGPIAAALMRKEIKEDDEKPDADKMPSQERESIEQMLAFFPEDGSKVDTAALVRYYRDNHESLPKDIRNIFDKDLQKAIAKVNQANNAFENNAGKHDLTGLPDGYQAGKPGLRAWLNRVAYVAEAVVGKLYNFTVDEAMETFNPLPWQPDFEVSYPIVTLVRGYRPGFDGDARFLTTPTRGYVNAALTDYQSSPNLMIHEGTQNA